MKRGYTSHLDGFEGAFLSQPRAYLPFCSDAVYLVASGQPPTLVLKLISIVLFLFDPGDPRLSPGRTRWPRVPRWPMDPPMILEHSIWPQVEPRFFSFSISIVMILIVWFNCPVWRRSSLLFVLTVSSVGDCWHCCCCCCWLFLCKKLWRFLFLQISNNFTNINIFNSSVLIRLLSQIITCNINLLKN
jgi:hypothetical protein